MKVRIEKQNDRIDLPDDFAALEEIRDDGSFLYRFKYNANIQKILGPDAQHRAIRVNINIVKNTPVEKTVRIFDKGFAPEDIIRRLKAKESLQRQLNRRKRGLRLKQKRSDITKRIPNNETRRLSLKQRNLFNRHTKRRNRKEPLQLKSFFRTKVKAVASLNAGFRSAPILELNLNKDLRRQEIQVTSRKIRTESLRLLFRDNQDPASWIGQRTRSVFPAKKQHRGIKSKTSFFSRHQNDPKLKHKMDTLVRSYLSKTIVSRHEQLQGSKFVTVIEKVSDDVARLEETMQINPGTITGDTFLVEFDLMNPKGLMLQRITKVVRHTQNVAKLTMTYAAPAMTVAPFGKRGRNLIKLQQLDEHGVKVAIYRKEISASRLNLSDEYQKIKVIDLTPEDGVVLVEDRVVSNNPIIYRAIPVGVHGNLGAEFASSVVRSERITTGGKENYLRRPCFLTLYNEIQDRTNVLFIDNIPNEPISLEVHRRDTAISKKDFQLVETIYLEEEVNRPVEVNDDGLKPGRIYEYKCKLLFPDGAKMDGGNNLVMQFTPLESNVVSVDIQNLEFDQDDDTIDVTFDIVKTAISKELDTVKSALASQELTEYDDAIKEKKDKLQDLFFVRVVRHNLISGETEDFGVVESETFSDKELGPVKNVAELETGGAYKYAVIVHARPAETLIPDFTRTVNSGSTDEYELTPSKFLHPVTLSGEGSLVTESSLGRNHAESAFTQGKIVEIKYVDVDLGKFLPKIHEAKAEKVNSTRTLLRWKVKGDADQIDHFIIVLEINGMRTIIGKSHSVGGSNSFQFVDVLDNGEHGALEYLITPVYYDYSRGTEVRLDAISI